MKINPDYSNTTKLCHARPGQVVQIHGPNGFIQPELYLVCVSDEAAKQFKLDKLPPEGLYKLQGSIYLTNLETGVCLPAVPNLSSQVTLYRDATVTLDSPE